MNLSGEKWFCPHRTHILTFKGFTPIPIGTYYDPHCTNKAALLIL